MSAVVARPLAHLVAKTTTRRQLPSAPKAVLSLKHLRQHLSTGRGRSVRSMASDAAADGAAAAAAATEEPSSSKSPGHQVPTSSAVSQESVDPEILAFQQHQSTAARLSLAEEARTLVCTLGK